MFCSIHVCHMSHKITVLKKLKRDITLLLQSPIEVKNISLPPCYLTKLIVITNCSGTHFLLETCDSPCCQQGISIQNNCISLAFGSILLLYVICMPFLYISILRYGLPLTCCLKILFVVTSMQTVL